MLSKRAFAFADIVPILKRRWWVVLIPLVLVPIAAVAFSYTITPMFLSQTLVLIESQKVPDSLVKPVISSDLDSRLASMKEQILSRSSLQPIIERYNLYPSSHVTVDDRIDMARKNIDIKPISSEVSHSSSLPGFFISFKSTDPHTAQLVCSDITTLFTGENLKSREEAAEGTTSFIESQLASAKRGLDEQDSKLADFQRQYMGRLPDESAPNVNMLTSLNTQLEASSQALNRMEQDRSYAQSMLSQQQAMAAATATPAAIPSSASEAQQVELQGLLTQRTELLSHDTASHPDVVAIDRRIAEARQQIARSAGSGGKSATSPAHESAGVQQLRAQIHALDIGIADKHKEQGQLQGSIRMYQDRIQASPLVEEQYKKITRDTATAQAFYDDLLSKRNQSKMATDLELRQQGEQFRVMDAANLPDAPYTPKRGMFLMGGIVGGLLFGLLIAAGLEFKDTTLRNERDMHALTKLPVLAIIGNVEADTAPATKLPKLPRLKRAKSGDAAAAPAV